MDLIGEDPVLDLRGSKFRIYSKNQARAPQFIGAGAEINNSMISEGCQIYGKVVNSILSGGVVVEEGAEIHDSVIMDDVTVESGAKVYMSIIDMDTVVKEGAVVGTQGCDKSDITVVAKGTVIKPACGGKN